MKLYAVFVKRDADEYLQLLDSRLFPKFDDAVAHMRENIFPHAIFHVGTCGDLFMSETTTFRYEDVYNEQNNVPF